ncbi:MAG: hypothetical protein ABI243_11475 [Lapillicoccus sp.]
MAIFSKGADPEALEQSANRLAGYAKDCESVRTVAGETVHSLKGQWGGGDLGQLLDQLGPARLRRRDHRPAAARLPARRGHGRTEVTLTWSA